MKVQSFSDIITNSSSEIFVFKSNMPKKFLRKLINEHVESHMYTNEKNIGKDETELNFYSGTGGVCDLYTVEAWNKKYSDWGEKVDSDKYDYVLDIDNSFNATINYLENNFENVKRID